MNSWQRLEKVIKWTGMSVNAFAHHIGLKRSENLYQIKKGNHGISRDLADLISSNYKNISKGWLITGEGEMFIEKPLIDGTFASDNGIPYYEIDVASVLKDGGDVRPTAYISVPHFTNCDIAAHFIGDSMAPMIPNGSIVVLKSITKETIIPGESYLIETPEYTTIRNIRIADDPSKVRLVPVNTASYDEISLPLDRIKSVYLVKGVIQTKIL